MNLIVCPSRIFAVYMLAYIEQFGFGRQFEILIEDGSEAPEKKIQISQKISGKDSIVFPSNLISYGAQAIKVS
jgi:hypothetical protein